MTIEQLILEEYTKIQEQAADKLRKELPSGYSEKGSEIDSGGKMSIQAVNLFIKFFKYLKKELPNIKIVISAGNDKFHKKYQTRHNTGEALDFVIEPNTPENIESVLNVLKQFKSENSDFKF